MSQALYRKWRPADFGELVGQEHVTTTLRNAIAGGRIRHAYLFAGPRGTGKTSAARLLAKAVNCVDPDPTVRPCNHCHLCQAVNEGRLLDLIEIDAASNTGVDNIRDLRDKIHFSPSEGQYKVYVIDECHQLSGGAFNALLKTLEEPPPHALFVLATTEAHKVPATVASRCQCFTFRRLPTSVMREHLQAMCTREGLQADSEALALIARQATGSLRDAISLLDQLVISPDEPVTLARAQALLGTAGGDAVASLVDAWLAGQAAQGLEVIATAIDEGSDPRQFTRQVVEHLRNLLLFKLSGEDSVEASPDTLKVLQRQAGGAEPRRLLGALKRWTAVTQELRAAWQPQLPLELAFVESLGAEEPASMPPLAAVRSMPVAASAPPITAPAATSGAPPIANRSTPPAAPTGRAAAPGASVTPAGSSASRTTAGGATAAGPGAAGAGAAGPAAGLPAVSLQQVATHWSDVMNAVKARNRNAVAVVREATPLAVEGTTLVLAFEHSFHRERVTEDKVRGLLQDVLAQVLGVPLQIRCVLQNEAVLSTGRGSGDELVEWAKNELGATSSDAG